MYHFNIQVLGLIMTQANYRFLLRASEFDFRLPDVLPVIPENKVNSTSNTCTQHFKDLYQIEAYPY